MGSAVLGEAIRARFATGQCRRKGTRRAADAAETFGSLVFNDEVQQTRLPKPVYQALRRTIDARRAARRLGRRRGRDGDEGMGGRARRDALHALVPAADRHHRRKARLVSVSRTATAKRVAEFCGKELMQGRTRRVELPVRRHALHLRSARLHGVGSRRARRGCSTAAAR